MLLLIVYLAPSCLSSLNPLSPPAARATLSPLPWTPSTAPLPNPRILEPNPFRTPHAPHTSHYSRLPISQTFAPSSWPGSLRLPPSSCAPPSSGRGSSCGTGGSLSAGWGCRRASRPGCCRPASRQGSGAEGGMQRR